MSRATSRVQTGASAPAAAEHVGPVQEWVSADCLEPLDDVVLPQGLDVARMRDTAPLPPRHRRESYWGDRHYDYWRSGLRHALKTAAVSASAGVPITPDSRVLELGPSTCRVLRHFHFQLGVEQVWGAEINPTSVQWVMDHLPPAFRVFTSAPEPHLPLPDESFDLVYAMSVFTHIDRHELAWLLELRRILRPGGVLAVSVHSERTWLDKDPQINLFRNLVARGSTIQEGAVTLDDFERPMPRERVTFTFPGPDGANCQVFHAESYLRRVWGRFMEIVEVQPRSISYHDLVVMRK